MLVKKRHLVNHSKVTVSCSDLNRMRKACISASHSCSFLSKKIIAAILATATMSAPLMTMPVYADSNVDVETSGEVSEDMGQEPDPVRCSGGVNYSDTSALDEGEGNLVCAQSNGTWTTISGNESPTSYHWVAWYKDKLKNDVDIKDENGNYKGFSQSKVSAWEPFAGEIKELNDGAYPEAKDYVYPQDTTSGDLDFWTDIAGYYTVMGDPKYENIELTAYEQVVYAKETTEEETINLTTAADGITMGPDGSILSPEDAENYVPSADVNRDFLDDGGDRKEISLKEYKEGWSEYRCFKNKDGTEDCNHKVTSRTAVMKLSDGSYVRVTQKHDTNGMSSMKVERTQDGKKWVTDSKYNGSLSWDGFADYKKGDKSNATYSTIGPYGSYPQSRFHKYNKSSPSGSKEEIWKNGETDTVSKPSLFGDVLFETIDEEKIAGPISYDSSGKTATRTYTTTSYYYKTREIAKATINSAYATELSQIKDLQVVKGSGKDVTLKADQTDDSFWGKVVPSYWNNEGVITIKNDANMPYHFEAEDVFTTDNDEVVSLYSLLKTTDKEFTFTHGFSNIKDTDLDNTKYPTDIEENCVTTKSTTGKDKQVCSKKQTPLIKFDLKLNEDVKPQEEIDEDEVEKNVTLTKDNDKEDKEKQEEGK